MALGKQFITIHPEQLNYETLQAMYGCDSTHCVGSLKPSQNENFIM